MDFPLSLVSNVSVSQAGAGAGQYNTSNIGVFTEEVPAASFGALGYSIYTSPQQVGIDFGTSSKTYAKAVSVFSQTPNILAGGGYFVAIPMIPATQGLAFSGVPASGQMVVNYNGNSSQPILFSDTQAQIQAKIQQVAGLQSAIVTGSMAAGLSIQLLGTYGVQPLLTVSGNTLQTSGSVAITTTVSTSTAGETLAAAITRTANLVQYFGIMCTQILSGTDTAAAAAVVQATPKIAFFGTRSQADVSVGGRLDLLRQGSQDQCRGLGYFSSSDMDVYNFVAAYASRNMSVDFTGTNTTITAHLKDLKNIVPDPGMTTPLLALCQAAGVDVYISLQGVAKTFTSGLNNFFDRVYNRQWFTGALGIASFNLFAQTATKIPQTEDGSAQLRAVLRQVCAQGITNQYGAPGTWTSPNTFGVLADFLNNISQSGFYIYTAPVSQQNTADRAARKMPLAQIAFKEAGAGHSANVLVNLNA